MGAIVEEIPWKKDAMSQTLQRHQPSHVFSLLGTTKSKNRSEAQRGKKASYDLVDRDLSILLLKSAQSLKVRPKFVFLSSMGVVENTQNRYLRARAEVVTSPERGVRFGQLGRTC